MQKLTTILASSLLLLTPAFADAQEPVRHKEYHGNIGCIKFGTTQDTYCDGTVLRNFYIARPKADGKLREKVQEGACKVYEGSKTVVRTTGAIVGFTVQAAECVAGKAVEGVEAVENYLGKETRKIGQFLQGACPSRCYQTDSKYKYD